MAAVSNRLAAAEKAARNTLCARCREMEENPTSGEEVLTKLMNLRKELEVKATEAEILSRIERLRSEIARLTVMAKIPPGFARRQHLFQQGPGTSTDAPQEPA